MHNLHRDFLRQFQRQPDDTENIFERQQGEIERLVKDSIELCEEREKNQQICWCRSMVVGGN